MWGQLSKVLFKCKGISWLGMDEKWNWCQLITYRSREYIYFEFKNLIWKSWFGAVIRSILVVYSYWRNWNHIEFGLYSLPSYRNWSYFLFRPLYRNSHISIYVNLFLILFTFSFMSPPSTTQFQLLFLFLSYSNKLRIKTVSILKSQFLWDGGYK